jgi:hypothetical protein
MRKLSTPKGPLEKVAEIVGHPVTPGGIADVLPPPEPFRPTGPGDWILSLRETKIELRHFSGQEAHAGRLFRYATHESFGSANLIENAILELVERKILTPTRYAPWMPAPTMMWTGAASQRINPERETWEARRTHPIHWYFKVSRELPY